jgi:DNA-binding transcriptional LysR family regulator
VQLHQLSYVMAVAEERSFTRAAARLHLAQPSLSRQIGLLERELGVQLFFRGPGAGPVELTGDGRALLPFIRRVLADVDAMTAEARALTGLTRGRLTIGATPSLATRFLPSALAAFHASYPQISLSVLEAGSRELTQRVADGEVDLALVVAPNTHRMVTTTPLFEDRLVLALPRGHPLARRRSVRVADLDGLAMVIFREGYDLRSTTLAACQQAGVTPRLVSEGGEMDGIIALVAAGLGAAVIPELVVRPDDDIVARPFARPGLSRTIEIAQRGDRPLSRAAQAMATALGTHAVATATALHAAAVR